MLVVRLVFLDCALCCGKTPQNNCQILLQFRDKLPARESITNKATIDNYDPYVNAKTFIDKISSQRFILRSQTFTTTSQVRDIGCMG